MSELFIDINADLGESEESIASGADCELMRYITSANVACGGHAGDERTMRKTLSVAKELNVAVGAHPGYPDRANFGRLESGAFSRGNSGFRSGADCVANKGRGFSGRDHCARETPRRAVSRGQQQARGCAGDRPGCPGLKSKANYGWTSGIFRFGDMALDRIAGCRRSFRRPRLRAGRIAAQAYSAGRIAR